MTPKTPMPSMMRLVAIGRRIKTSEMFMRGLDRNTCTDRTALTCATAKLEVRTKKLEGSSLHLSNDSIKREHHVQVGPVELGAHDLLDLRAGLLLADQLVHAVAELERAVAKLTHFCFARDIAMTGHDVVEVELQRGIERRRPFFRAAAARIVDQLRHVVTVRKHVAGRERPLRRKERHHVAV